MLKQKIILRADGNKLIGFGHIYRLLALADILKEHFYIAFALYKTSDFIEQEIKSYCDEIIILPGELPYKTADEISAGQEINFDLKDILNGDEIVVLDGYHFGINYQKAVKEKNCKLVCIDDLATNRFVADAVINHAPGLDQSIYKMEAYTKLYTGLDYAILRKPFMRPHSSINKIDGDVFISLGGSDYFQLTLKIARLLVDVKELNTLHIMYSNSFPKGMIDTLEKISNETTRLKLYMNLSANEIADLMDTCEYAFVSASTVLLEAYSRNLICFTGFYTTNHFFIYNGFIKLNKAIGLGNLKDLNPSILNEVFKNPDYYPNQNSDNLDTTSKQSDPPAKNLLKLFLDLNLKLRSVELADMKLYFDWANDEVVRNNSINQNAIEWDNHVRWFTDKLKSKYFKLYVLDYSATPVGQIRTDLNEDGNWVINYSIDKLWRGFGFGKKIVQLLIEKEPGKLFLAFVKTSNDLSNKIFQSNGFDLSGVKIINNEKYNAFEYLK
ncbi:MAG TPA: GNAT family N-acetyltransferase [Chitinophagaceae bacterium]|nr:GNAT family N-acetyltransferase [Chitinophagaceae bacterium]